MGSSRLRKSLKQEAHATTARNNGLRFENFPRRHYPVRVRRVTLSPTCVEHPCFNVLIRALKPSPVQGYAFAPAGKLEWDRDSLGYTVVRRFPWRADCALHTFVHFEALRSDKAYPVGF